MASNAPSTPIIGADSPITIKVTIDGANRKFKFPLRDLSINVFPDKIRDLLQIPSNQQLTLERFSDSSASYIALDARNPSSYKQLARAAKAKGKIRLRANAVDEASTTGPKPEVKQEAPPKYSTLPTLTNILNPIVQESTPAAAASETKPSVQRTAAAVEATRYRLDKLRSMAREGQIEYSNLKPLVKSSTVPVARDPPNSTASTANEEEKNHAAFSGESSRYNVDNLRSIVREGEIEYTTSAPLRNHARTAPAARNPASVQPTRQCCWQVCCNNCDSSIADVHFHCSVCDGGDYDICEGCLKAGAHCKGQGHWLIKRYITGGSVINSTTEKIEPKQKALPIRTSMPTSVPASTTTSRDHEKAPTMPTRTCNACVRILPERLLVHCAQCSDFDLCISCHVDNKSAHHPEHSFKPLVKDANIGSTAAALCQPGRNVRHWAICDSCDKTIYGVRHKCLDCPDFDFCSDCVGKGSRTHGHRFVKIYEPIATPTKTKARHCGIYCDGPLCNGTGNQGYIHGIRYKCAICHDTDFCANCEAHPDNKHNQSHPLIKFKTMVRGVNITTMDTAQNGNTATLGDRGWISALRPKPSTEPLPRYTPSTTTETDSPSVAPVEKPMPLSPLSKEITEDIKMDENNDQKSMAQLQAHFKHDLIADGTRFTAYNVFMQCWTLHNPGPNAWPAGCSVRHIGGDYMLLLNENKPASVPELALAQESNICEKAVEVGQTASFSVTLKAPARPGKHISYWRLKAPDGTPFGHKLWCDIEVSPMSVARSRREQTIADLEGQLAISRARFQETFETAQARKDPISSRLKWYEQHQKHLQKQKDTATAQKDVAMAQLHKAKEQQKTLYEHFKKLSPCEPSTSSAQTSPTAPPTQLPASTPVGEAPEAKTVEQAKTDLAQSTMVFPKLDKESPVSSTHEDAPAAGGDNVTRNETTEAETETETVSTTDADKDVNSVVFSDSEEDDGFFTDEEYDILDASDEEVITNGAAAS